MNAALYIHFPFCRKKCSYCDFYSIIDNQRLIEQFLKCLRKEIEIHAEQPFIKDLNFQTIYLGGGTPSLLSISKLETILNSVYKNINVLEDSEVTIEINPDTVNIEKLTDIYHLGFNRLSIGVQSFNDVELQTLGRIHDAERAISSIRMAQQVGFNNINIDLIFAVPGQSLSSWKKNLNKALEFSPQHISMYGLTVESGTFLNYQITQGSLDRCSEILESEMYLNGVEFLEANRFQQYEISNFALPGFFSVHNKMYWDGNPYLGLGPGAHSFWKSTRQWNIADVFEYTNLLTENKLPLENSEQLTRQQEIMEFILLNLRKKTGIDLTLFKERFKVDFNHQFKDSLQRIDGKFICLDNRNLRLTTEGFLLYDEICSYFA